MTKPGLGLRVLGLALLTVLAGCESTESVVPGAAQPPQVAVATAVSTPEPTQIVAALPRTVDSLALSMSRTAVEAQIGALDCHDSDDDVHVCRPQDAARGRQELEIYFFRDTVVSIAYEIPPPAEVWSHLEALTHQYGNPSLNGMTQRDVRNRLHEIYGWRDLQTIYSTRFVWAESPPPRHVVGTVVTIWDRAAYAAWEDEKARHVPAQESSRSDGSVRSV
jgi:hypothetical protein